MLVLNIPKLYDKKRTVKRNVKPNKAKLSLFDEILRQEIKKKNKTK